MTNPSSIRLTVCELRNDPEGLARDWEGLVQHLRGRPSDLVLLPEMPYSPWLAATRHVVADRWKAAVQVHEGWIARLHELNAEAVLATRPVEDGGSRFNQSLVWTRRRGLLPAVHRKTFLPEEEGFWEASWYARGPVEFAPMECGNLMIGFMICTELWFLEHARRYGRQGVQLIVCPRATLAPTVDKWVIGGRVASVVSGAFCLSSNLSGPAEGGADWGGTGWIIEPEEGQVLGTTSREQPFLTLDVELAAVERARATYPRYVKE